jgi:hypothetical protein
LNRIHRNGKVLLLPEVWESSRETSRLRSQRHRRWLRNYSGRADRDNSGIGLYNESSLHAALKNLYGSDSAQFEVNIDGFVVDVVQGKLLIEIQTGSFSHLNKKLFSLLDAHRVKVVYPAPVEKTIVMLDKNRERVLYSRRSPKRKSEVDVVDQLIYILPHLGNPGFSLELLLTREEELRIDDGQGSWRRGGKSILDRRLLEIVGAHIFTEPMDYTALLPEVLPEYFTNKDLSQIMGISRSKATKITYCFKHLGLLGISHKEGNAQVFFKAYT